WTSTSPSAAAGASRPRSRTAAAPTRAPLHADPRLGPAGRALATTRNASRHGDRRLPGGHLGGAHGDGRAAPRSGRAAAGDRRRAGPGEGLDATGRAPRDPGGGAPGGVCGGGGGTTPVDTPPDTAPRWGDRPLRRGPRCGRRRPPERRRACRARRGRPRLRERLVFLPPARRGLVLTLDT